MQDLATIPQLNSSTNAHARVLLGMVPWCSPLSPAKAYYDKSPDRTWYLRHDSLAAVMSLANVAAGAKVRTCTRMNGCFAARACVCV